MRRVTNRILASLMALVMVLVMIPTAFAEPTNDDIVILHTNDVHTYIDGSLNYAVLAGIKAELEKEYKTVLLVDAATMHRVPLTVPWTRARPSLT